ncbi:MAG: glycogen/starch/alpha-glucan phosphorylase [Polyangiaceae bacterium]|nr:glycogen/starch/alpha-glucan phosphorylase [Polyangiaceae bacterium]
MPLRTHAPLPSHALGLDADSLRESLLGHVLHTRGKHPGDATSLDVFWSAARAVRDRLFERWTRTMRQYDREQPKRVYWLSMEFLMGRLLEESLLALGVRDAMRDALADVGLELDDVLGEEPDAGLGNGGLGRLSACYLESMATLGIAGMGYGLRYEYGIFQQDLVRGAQLERPDQWLQHGNVWEVARPERLYCVRFGGRVIHYTGPGGRPEYEWVDAREVNAMAYDVPVPGHGNGVVNTLRLWSAKATREFELGRFHQGDYVQAVQEKSESENITRVLYPNDEQLAGKRLRLEQEYFLVSATLQDVVRRHLVAHPDLRNLPDHAVFHLNDTHPALAVPELMRLLLDHHKLRWDEAWSITQRCFAYTNHTILPEALERWPAWLFEQVLPRHLQIVYEINQRFLDDVRRRRPTDDALLRRVSLIEEGDEKKVRMAHLAIVGSSRVNGVSELHSRLLREHVFADFDALMPGKLGNVTNGVTPRRWLLGCNPELAKILHDRIGRGWESDLTHLAALEPLADDPELHRAWREMKRARKLRLAAELRRRWGIVLEPDHLLASHVKRIHEYKRQLLNALHVVSLWQRYREAPPRDLAPRTFLFAGKAAPGYAMAKLVVHLIGRVARTIDEDPAVREHLRVVFVPNYGVSWAELIIPASDVSEQISTAGTEASGTGNMKFALNGALTLGTLDGANVELAEAVGHENFFAFGLDVDEVHRLRERGYDPRSHYLGEPELRSALDAIASGAFSRDDPALFRPIVDSLLDRGDPYLVLADFRSYAACQRSVEAAWHDSASWTRRSILNVARSGRFSSDESIRNYARDIWGVPVR